MGRFKRPVIAQCPPQSHHAPRELWIHIYVQRKFALVFLLWSQPPEEQKMGTFLESLELYQVPIHCQLSSRKGTL